MLGAIGATPIAQPEGVATTRVDAGLKHLAGDLYASA
jgi:hypothetical protein